MILLICFWEKNLIQSIVFFTSWTVLHKFFVFSLSHVSAAGHIGDCCNNLGAALVGPCQRRIIEAVRAILAFTHSVLVTSWGIYLLATKQNDVEVHAYLYLCSLGYHLYDVYWNFRDRFGPGRPRNLSKILKHDVVGIDVAIDVRHVVQSLLFLVLLALSLRALSLEMTGWRNSVVLMLLDFHPTSTWNNPTKSHRKALAQHLLGKSSAVVALLTATIVAHELPFVFGNSLRLLKISKHQRLNRSIVSEEETKAEMALALGVAAFKRERGMCCEKTQPGFLDRGIEGQLAIMHCLTYLISRCLGGTCLLKWILHSKLLIMDTPYVSVALFFLGYVLWSVIGVMTKAKKKSSCKAKFPRQLAMTLSETFVR